LNATREKLKVNEIAMMTAAKSDKGLGGGKLIPPLMGRC
jgi:hypothetical protein